MKYQSLPFLFATALAFINVHAQPGRIDSVHIPRTVLHYQHEYTLDTPSDPSAWHRQPRGLQAAFVSTDEAYFRTEVPNITPGPWKAAGWRGERLNAIVLAWSADSLSQVRLTMGELKSASGHKISASNLKLQLVRYVLSNYPYDAREVSCGDGPTGQGWLLPDRLETFERFDLPGRTVRPVWLSIDIPADAIPGTYNGVVTVTATGSSRTLPVQLQVQKPVLPSPANWGFRLDLWQNPSALAHYYQVEPWSDEHKVLLRKHLNIYAQAGGKYITTYAVHSPWSDITYHADEGMIQWVKLRNGGWKFDYSIFDQYVQLAMDAGINKAITIYTPIPWGERFRYNDEATGNFVYERWLPTSDTFKTNWNVFLTDLKKHLEKKGWLQKTFLGINENAMEQTLTAIDVIRRHSKDWKITYAGDWHPELDKLLDDYSCVYGKEPGVKEVRGRAARGQKSTWYICCTPPKPNTFVFSPPVEGRWLGWYTQAHGYDGLLRWAYDNWTADPSRDARHLIWGAGDCFMVYPGASSSIRFEKMREGIVDFEKIAITRARTGKSSNPEIRRLVTELDNLMTDIDAERSFRKEKLAEDIRKGQKILDALSDLME